MISTHREEICKEVGKYALHLAAEHGSPDVIICLLQKRSDIERLDLENPALIQDNDLKFPLHIACEKNVNPSVIQMLLQEDPNKKALSLESEPKENKEHLTPIHLLCTNKEAKSENADIAPLSH